jgi:hypothetical protein
VRDDAGELASLDLDKWRKPGYGLLVRDDGMPLDRAREAAEEAGYIGSPNQYQVATLDELKGAIDAELGGKPVYSRLDDNLFSVNSAYDDAVRGREPIGAWWRRSIRPSPSSASRTRSTIVC